MVELIESKNIMPHRFRPNLTPLEVKKELSIVRSKINRLPDFTLPLNILRLSLFLRYLKKDFEDESIIFYHTKKE